MSKYAGRERQGMREIDNVCGCVTERVCVGERERERDL